MLRIVTTGLLAIGVLGGTLMPAAAEQAVDPCSGAKTIEIQPIGGWQVMTGASAEDGAPGDGALVLARASRNTVVMMACQAGKASYALFDSAFGGAVGTARRPRHPHRSAPGEHRGAVRLEGWQTPRLVTILRDAPFGRSSG
jgi:hypothetical protein